MFGIFIDTNADRNFQDHPNDGAGDKHEGPDGDDTGQLVWRRLAARRW